MRSFLKSQSIDCIAWTSISRVTHNYREKHNNYRVRGQSRVCSTKRVKRRPHLKNKKKISETLSKHRTFRVASEHVDCIYKAPGRATYFVIRFFVRRVYRVSFDLRDPHNWLTSKKHLKQFLTARF